LRPPTEAEPGTHVLAPSALAGPPSQPGRSPALTDRGIAILACAINDTGP
jgi:hypothetical protein